MARRANPRKVKIHLNYTIEEAAEALSVSIPTVRSWIKGGLPALTSKRPYLIMGSELRECRYAVTKPHDKTFGILKGFFGIIRHGTVKQTRLDTGGAVT